MKKVLITGSSSGIGKATAKEFASKGWQVAATMRTPEKKSDLTGLENVTLYALDVTEDEQTIFDIVGEIINDLNSIDVLINNAGIGVFGTFEAADFELIEKQFNTNVFGLMRVTKAILPHFRARGQGIIVNLSSGVGRISLPMQSLYSSTKFAIEGFSEALQYELRPLGIQVKLVEPGNIKTNFFNSLTITDVEKFEAYQPYQAKVMSNHVQLNEQGSTPEMVTKVIYQAATERSERLRYPAGRDASFFLKMRKLLPDSVFFKLVRRQLEK